MQTSNVYYHPEQFGLTPVGEVEWSDLSYNFDTTVVWRDKNGQLYYAEDSGCSCPAPFANCDSLDDLTPCTFFELAEHLKERLHDNPHIEADVVNVLSHVRQVGSTW